MKCPKCGYISFETSDSCRKCSNDLSAFREAHGLTPIVLPAAVRASRAKSLGGQEPEGQPAPKADGDMFNFDLPPQPAPQAAPAASSDPFAFISPQPAADGGGISFGSPAASSHDPFADLLETTPVVQKPAESATPQGAAGQGFELNSFSWDDTPEPDAAGAPSPSEPTKKIDDDFSSLFGDLGSLDKKP